MDDRQVYALANPIVDTETAVVEGYRVTAPQPDGNLLMSVLAVDR